MVANESCVVIQWSRDQNLLCVVGCLVDRWMTSICKRLFFFFNQTVQLGESGGGSCLSVSQLMVQSFNLTFNEVTSIN